MQAPEYAVLNRECRAVQIPEGTPSLLSSGTRVRITQALGGAYTVVTDRGYLLRIDARDADAIGKADPGEAAGSGPAGLEGATLEDRTWASLRTCFDPEIPVNIVDLGLVYNCEITELPGGGSRVDIKMTLTAPGCGMGPVLAQDVKEKVQALPGVEEADVEVVFDPQWNQNMMSEAARLELGLF
ncbi:MAG TPA: putative Fe-S cluster assembly protein SufT [Thermoanaerobaculia bacterium]|nr:putative Fe-S cluster assembly protein SufT [Thermoanaerobaculia bacterium]